MAVKSKESLTGKELLAKVKENDGLTKRELAKECGYYTVGKDGQVRVNLAEFYDALLSAKGIQLEPEKTKDGPKARNDLKHMGIRKDLQPPSDDDRSSSSSEEDQETQNSHRGKGRKVKKDKVKLAPACFTCN